MTAVPSIAFWRQAWLAVPDQNRSVADRQWIERERCGKFGSAGIYFSYIASTLTSGPSRNAPTTRIPCP
jgi:hypothetical protein